MRTKCSDSGHEVVLINHFFTFRVKIQISWLKLEVSHGETVHNFETGLFKKCQSEKMSELRGLNWVMTVYYSIKVSLKSFSVFIFDLKLTLLVIVLGWAAWWGRWVKRSIWPLTFWLVLDGYHCSKKSFEYVVENCISGLSINPR